MLFYTKGDQWTFNADAVRVPHKWTAGQLRADGTTRDYRRGKLADDVFEYHSVMPWGAEKKRGGYPTQKPLVLLERIISASSNLGDLVLDAFCGCGTTMEAAQNLGRGWIGIDLSQTAIRVVENRLRKIGAPPPEVIGLVQTEDQLRKLDPFEFQNWAINAVQGRHSTRKIADMGIDGFTFLENHPIQVKQMDSVGRPVIDSLVGVLEREKDKKGMVIAFGFTKGAIGEVSRLKRESAIDIHLLACSELLAGVSASQLVL